MKNDARFFFCFTGFVGFLLFFLIASLVHKNFVMSLVHGALGCLTFAIYGRFLLGILLKASLINSPTNSPPTSPTTRSVENTIPKNRQTLPKTIARKREKLSSEVAKPMVDEKV